MYKPNPGLSKFETDATDICIPRATGKSFSPTRCCCYMPQPSPVTAAAIMINV